MRTAAGMGIDDITGLADVSTPTQYVVLMSSDKNLNLEHSHLKSAHQFDFPSLC